MFARFDENPAMTLRVIKETKRYGHTDGRTDNVKTVYPLQTKFAGGIIINFEGREAKGLSKGRYDETFAGEDEGSRSYFMCMKCSEYRVAFCVSQSTW